MSDPAAGPADTPERITVETATVRRLVDTQFPRWAGLPIRPARVGGWDNYTFRLGPAMVIRMPSAAEYALTVQKEQHWLPRFAGRLAQPIPSVLGVGRPGDGYPFPWSIHDWIDGDRATRGALADPVAFGRDLGEFLASLRAVTTRDGPQPGLHNWYRGAGLERFDGTVHGALDALSGHVDTHRAARVWERARMDTWDGHDRWFHGDLSPGNLLQAGGRLCAVIDFGACGVGDPACDLAAAWTLMTDGGRVAFRERLGVDDGEWARGQGWALWNALWRAAAHVGGTPRTDGEESLAVIHALLRSSAM